MSYALSRMLGSRFRVLVALIALLLPAGLAYLWYEAGGVPRNHDRYGFVAIDSAKTLELPAGQVRLYFQAPADSKSGATNLPPVPDGLVAEIRPVGEGSGPLSTGGGPGAALKQQDLPSWLFSSSADGVGWKPIAKVDVPAAAVYTVEVRQDGAGNSEAGISLGEAPWTPFGSALVGAIFVFFLFTGVFAAIAAIATAGRRILEESQRSRG